MASYSRLRHHEEEVDMSGAEHQAILMVGAGPTGLTMANECSPQQPVLREGMRKNGRDTAGVHARPGEETTAMFHVLQVLTVLLVVLAMCPALAHALELPGKRRLTQEAYFAIQPIYYPGFTIAGLSEPLSIIATIILFVLTPRGSAAFWLTLVALCGLLGMQAVYWLWTHPVNQFWLQGEKLSSVGAGFFSFAAASRRGHPGETGPVDWTAWRDRWEYSHVGRAGLATVSLIALVIAIS
jgi:hypothetical protein